MKVNKNYIQEMVKEILGDKDEVRIQVRELFEKLSVEGKLSLATVFSSAQTFSLSTYLNTDTYMTLYRADKKNLKHSLEDLIKKSSENSLVIPFINATVDSVADFNNIFEHTKITESYIDDLPVLCSNSGVDLEELKLYFRYYLNPQSAFYQESLNEIKAIHEGLSYQEEEVDYYITPFLQKKLLRITFVDKDNTMGVNF